MTKEGKYVSRRRKFLKMKVMVVNGEQHEEWEGINTRFQPIASVNVAYPDSTSTPYRKDENKPEHLMSIQWSEIVIIIALTLKSRSSFPRDVQLINWNDGCTWNQKDRPRCLLNIMVETLKTQTMPIALITPQLPKNTRSNPNGRDLIIVSIPLKKHEDAREKMLYALLTW